MSAKTETTHMRGPTKFCQRGSNSDNVFLVDKGREDHNSTKSGTSSASKRNVILMVVAQSWLLAW